MNINVRFIIKLIKGVFDFQFDKRKNTYIFISQRKKKKYT